MAYILQIETTTQQCSVAISYKGKTIAVIEERTEGYSHSEKLHVFIEKLFSDTKILISNIQAIAVSKGPGSYTGLRIGVAASKGFCFALNLPLIDVNTLEIMAENISVDDGFIIPMLDARRMEVYTAVFDRNKKQIYPTTALVLNADSFIDIVDQQPCKVVGNGAEKFEQIQPKINANFDSEVYPSASQMSEIAWNKFQEK